MWVGVVTLARAKDTQYANFMTFIAVFRCGTEQTRFQF